MATIFDKFIERGMQSSKSKPSLFGSNSIFKPKIASASSGSLPTTNSQTAPVLSAPLNSTGYTTTTNQGATNPKQSYINNVIKPTTKSYEAPLNPYRPENAIIPPETPVDKETPSPTIGSKAIDTSARDTAFQNYLTSLGQTKAEKDARKKYLDFITNAESGIAGLEGQGRGIPLTLVRGQQEKLGRQAEITAKRLAGDVELAQGERQSTADIAKAKYEFEQGNLEAQKPIEVGGVLYQKQTDGSYLPITSKQDEGFTLGKDQVRYDAQGNIIAGGFGGDTGLSDSASTWAKAIQSGQAKLSDVPQDERAGALAAMGVMPETTTPGQQRSINQAGVALNALDKIFQNPALYRGALSRTVRLPGTPAKDLKEAIGTVQALVGFDELQKMRDASPTGGALGQVSEREIDFLQKLGGSLNLTQSDEQLQSNLNQVKQSFEVLKLVNSPVGTVGMIGSIPFTKAQDALIFQSPDGSMFERLPDGNLREVFNKVGGDTKTAATVNDAQRLAEAIGMKESRGSGGYQALGPVIKGGDRAYGKYQVMGNNIPSWTQEILGIRMTPQQFLANPKAQDKVAQAKLGQYIQKYGTIEDAASMWFSGRPVAQAGNRKDILGTTVPQYYSDVVRFYKSLG